MNELFPIIVFELGLLLIATCLIFVSYHHSKDSARELLNDYTKYFEACQETCFEDCVECYLKKGVKKDGE